MIHGQIVPQLFLATCLGTCILNLTYCCRDGDYKLRQMMKLKDFLVPNPYPQNQYRCNIGKLLDPIQSSFQSSNFYMHPNAHDVYLQILNSRFLFNFISTC